MTTQNTARMNVITQAITKGRAPGISDRRAVDNVLREGGTALQDEILDFLEPNGLAGSLAFDKAMAANAVKTFATRMVGAAEKEGSPVDPSALIVSKLTLAIIWDKLSWVMKGYGLDIRNGRVFGLLADLRGEAPAAEPEA